MKVKDLIVHLVMNYDMDTDLEKGLYIDEKEVTELLYFVGITHDKKRVSLMNYVMEDEATEFFNRLKNSIH